MDLSDVQWLGHLPLLALCLAAEEINVAAYDQRSITMPVSATTRAFLQRWDFYEIANAKKFVCDRPADILYQRARAHSCVLPIRAFAKHADVTAVRDRLRDTDTDVNKLLRTAAFLDEHDIRGLADVILYELCTNAVEHADTTAESFLFGRVSRPDDHVRPVQTHHAAAWEKDFFDAIRGEGMTEIVLGDAGVGIISSLAETANHFNIHSAAEILEWAFERFSTRKKQGNEHTRGLWAVRNRIHELRGLLYVRTSVDASGRSGGVSLSWDFLNEPSQDRPQIQIDPVPFRGTQVQILLPHRTPRRPHTFIAWKHPAFYSAKREYRPVGLQVPLRPPDNGEIGIRAQVERLDSSQVLFIDMSRMDENAWNRVAVDQLAYEITVGLRLRFCRVWLLNPAGATLEKFRASSWVSALWQRSGMLQPVVTMDAADKPPRVEFVAGNLNSRSSDPGDTYEARQVLVGMITDLISGNSDWIDPRVSLETMSPDEQTWITFALAMNAAVVDTDTDIDGRVTPSLDLAMLAAVSIEALLPHTLRTAIEEQLRQHETTGLAWYQLSSREFCPSYIDPRLLTHLHPAARNALDRWIERQVTVSRADYAIFWTSFAGDLLTRAIRARPGLEGLTYLRTDAALHEELDRIPLSSQVALLVPIIGSGTILEEILQHLEARHSAATIICIVDTIPDAQRAKLPLLAQRYSRGAFHCLLKREIPIYAHDEIARIDNRVPIVVIDPETSIPIVPVRSESSLISDGRFWSLAGNAQGLSNEPVAYRGRRYNHLLRMRSILTSEVLELVLDHFATCFPYGVAPDVICVTTETTALLRSTAAGERMRSRFPDARVVASGDPDVEWDRCSLEGKRVAIFSAEADDAVEISGLLKRYETARQIHVCVFINRISEPVVASFTRPPRVTFSAFRRLFSGSSEMRRSAWLDTLADLRPSCMSDRLLLFVDEQQTTATRRLRSEQPGELESMTVPLPRPAEDLFRYDDAYDFSSAKSQQDLQALVRRCDDSDAPWLRAILEEVACRHDTADRTSPLAADDVYLANVRELYPNAPLPAQFVRIAILSSLVLGRWEGCEEIAADACNAFAVKLFQDLQRETTPAFRAVCIRVISKLNRQLLIVNLDKFIDIARRDREVELTLSLELLAILEDQNTSELLLLRLNELVKRRIRVRGRSESAAEVAFHGLLSDLGLHVNGDGTVAFLTPDSVFSLVRSRPPDATRTIRALMRSVRALLGPRVRVLYYRRTYGDRFVVLDGWPQPRGSRVISDHDETDLRMEAQAVHPVGRDGFLRLSSEDGALPEISSKLTEAIAAAAMMMDLVDSPVMQIGTFHYARTVETFDAGPGGSQAFHPLREYARRVHSLLGADVSSLMVLDTERGVWRRDEVIGRSMSHQPLEFFAVDPRRVTVAVADTRLHLKFRDAGQVSESGFLRSAIAPWVEAWLSIPLTQQNGCLAVLNLWHHTPDWFSACDHELIRALSDLGGRIAQVQSAWEHSQSSPPAARKYVLDGADFDSISSQLRNLAQIAEGLAITAREANNDDLLVFGNDLFQYLKTFADSTIRAGSE